MFTIGKSQIRRFLIDDGPTDPVVRPVAKVLHYKGKRTSVNFEIRFASESSDSLYIKRLVHSSDEWLSPTIAKFTNFSGAGVYLHVRTRTCEPVYDYFLAEP